MLSPLFPGQNDIDQIFKVFQIMGTPKPSTWPVNRERLSYILFRRRSKNTADARCVHCRFQEVDQLPDYGKVIFPDMEPMDIGLFIPRAHPEDLEFLETMLVLNPK